jgi:hypothetical protein
MQMNTDIESAHCQCGGVRASTCVLIITTRIIYSDPVVYWLVPYTVTVLLLTATTAKNSPAAATTAAAAVEL